MFCLLPRHLPLALGHRPSRAQKIVLAAEKQNTFAYGIQRKSKKDREREEEKRKKEEEERYVRPMESMLRRLQAVVWMPLG